MSSPNPYRLPRIVVPERYELTIAPDLSASRFEGNVCIDTDVREATDRIVLNAADLTISRAMLRSDAGEITPERIEIDEQAERVMLDFGVNIAPGRWQLELDFSGELNDQLRGFYRSTFTGVDGSTQVIATTQFEATDARRAFPCWDEPDFKATFKVSLLVPSHLLAVSNGPEVARQDLGDGRVRIDYAETMRMSSYLVAFVIGPLEATDPVDVDGVPLRVIAPIGKQHLADFALEAGAFCLRYLTDYYGIPYPGEKVDLIAIPDFAFGAMENLGAITFRETSLLIDPSTTGLAEQRRVVDVVAHELAHMWFGDLVTMGWWEGIWLNEAFASFMEMKAVEAMHPEWHRWMAFAVDGGAERSGALNIDALSSSRPVEFPVESPDDANEMFDALTYGKGSAVLRMIEQYLGTEVFRLGVKHYLENHAYGNTVTTDLWASLDQASGTDVGSIMNTWILQAGYPQVAVTQEGTTVRLAQQRFLLSDDEMGEGPWKIPMQIKYSIDGALAIEKHLMTGPSLTLEVVGRPSWLIANAGGHGFYRVAYPPASLAGLTAVLPQLDRMERFTLLDDTFAFVVSGQAAAQDFLELAAAYRDETDQAVWQMLIAHLGQLHHLIPDDALTGFAARVRHLLGPIAARLGWEPAPGESDLDRLLRGHVLRGMGIVGDDGATIERAAEAAKMLLEDPHNVDPDVGQAGLFITANQGDIQFFEALSEAHANAETPQREIRFLQALCDVDAHDAVAELFRRILAGEIRNQDSAWVLMRMLNNRKTGIDVWDLIRRDWDPLIGSIPALTVRYIFEGLPALARYPEADEVVAFVKAHRVAAAAKTQEQALERLEVAMAMRGREADRLTAYLAETGRTD